MPPCTVTISRLSCHRIVARAHCRRLSSPSFPSTTHDFPLNFIVLSISFTIFSHSQLLFTHSLNQAMIEALTSMAYSRPSMSLFILSSLLFFTLGQVWQTVFESLMKLPFVSCGYHLLKQSVFHHYANH